MEASALIGGSFQKILWYGGTYPHAPLPWENLVVVLKNCEPELSYILAELFNICLKETCWKVLWVVPLFKNVGERSKAKNYCPVSLLSVISKVFEKLVNNRIVNYLEKCSLFSIFQYGFKSSWLTADLLTVVTGRTASCNSLKSKVLWWKLKTACLLFFLLFISFSFGCGWEEG